MKTIHHRFVEFVPEEVEEGIIYISVQYRTAVHLCVCGCGNKVVTPFSPTDWKLTFDGKTVSLSPSIGNWSFECKSHYFIEHNNIIHCRKWNDWEIDENRISDKKEKAQYYRPKKKKKWLLF